MNRCDEFYCDGVRITPPSPHCKLCGVEMGNLTHRREIAGGDAAPLYECGVCEANEYSFCASCFISCDGGIVKPGSDRGNVSYICCGCMLEGKLGPFTQLTITREELRHVKAVHKYTLQHGLPPVEIMSARVLTIPGNAAAPVAKQCSPIPEPLPAGFMPPRYSGSITAAGEPTSDTPTGPWVGGNPAGTTQRPVDDDSQSKAAASSQSHQ